VLHILSEYILALVIRHAKRMCRVVLSSGGLSGSTTFFPHHLINGTIFGGKKVTEREMCFDILYNVCLTHFSF
jgi:hypothetical protein